MESKGACDGIAFTCNTFGTLFAKGAEENPFNPEKILNTQQTSLS